MQRGPRFDVPRMQDDMVAKGWLPMDLARRARVSHMTVKRFFEGQHQTPRTAKKLAIALGRTVRDYMLPVESAGRVEA